MIVAMPWPCQASATTNATSARLGVDPDVGGVRDDLMLGTGRRHERSSGRRSRRRPPSSVDPVEIRHAEEPKTDRLERQALEERAHRRRVRRARDARAARSVAQRDIDRAIRQIARHGHAAHRTQYWRRRHSVPSALVRRRIAARPQRRPHGGANYAAAPRGAPRWRANSAGHSLTDSVARRDHQPEPPRALRALGLLPDVGAEPRRDRA